MNFNSDEFVVKAGLAKMLKGGKKKWSMNLFSWLTNLCDNSAGVIMDVVNVEQAKIAEAAGAVAVGATLSIPRGVCVTKA